MKKSLTLLSKHNRRNYETGNLNSRNKAQKMIVTSKVNKEHSISHLVVSSVAIILFLAFIDEGYYNFNWVYDPGSWVAVLIFSTIVLLFQVILFRILLRKDPFIGKLFSYLTIGLVGSFMLYYTII